MQELLAILARQNTARVAPHASLCAMELTYCLCSCALPHAGELQMQLDGVRARDAAEVAPSTAPRPPPTVMGEVVVGGPLDDPSYPERVGGLSDVGWEKTALREALDGKDLYK